MAASPSYQLLDFGAGRKLERFGPWVLDRPSPAAQGQFPASYDAWHGATARFERHGRAEGRPGDWSCGLTGVEPWLLDVGRYQMELKLTEFGHIGIFPEQMDNWRWIDRAVRGAGQPLQVLNLFAYTGGSTLAAAAAGAAVVHVDAAAGVVAWARRNAELSGLGGAPIRWIVEDATKFVRRELKRGRRYDAVILDPPSYGHGPKGEPWKLTEQLGELLALCHQLMADSPQFWLLSCHSGTLARAAALADYVKKAGASDMRGGKLVAQEMELITDDGRRLHAGASVRWCQPALESDGPDGAPLRDVDQSPVEDPAR